METQIEQPGQTTSNRGYFTPGQILLASLFGGLPAGLFLYRHNAHLFQKPKDGNPVFAIGMVLTILGIGAALFVHGAMAQSIFRTFGPISVILPFIVTKQTQKNDLKQYQEAGGLRASWGYALMAGFVSLIGVLAIVLLSAMVISHSEQDLT